METSPKEIVSDAMERAAMFVSFSIQGFGSGTYQFARTLPARPVTRRRPIAAASAARACERLLEALLRRERLAPAVAGSREALDRIRQPEVQRMRALELVPRERHRHGRSRRAARRI